MTIAEWIEHATQALENSGLHFGHGTDNARDEAVWLVLHAADAPLDGSFTDWGRTVDDAAAAEISRLLGARCKNGEPLAYLIGTAWFAGLEFEISPSVLVPRSPIAELILDGFRPWVESDSVRHIMDMCTGSGCIAIAAAHYLPQVQVDAIDISRPALQVASRNVRRHGLSERVNLIESNLFKSVPAGRYDLVLANPPYVPASTIEELPREYRSEPGLGLVSGTDGLDAALSIMVDAANFLGEDGVLICEVGESEEGLAAALPRSPFLWLEFERGGSGVFVMTRQQLEDSRSDVASLILERKNVT